MGFLSENTMFFPWKIDGKLGENRHLVVKSRYTPKMSKNWYPRLVGGTFTPPPLPNSGKKCVFGKIGAQTFFLKKIRPIGAGTPSEWQKRVKNSCFFYQTGQLAVDWAIWSRPPINIRFFGGKCHFYAFWSYGR